MKPADVCLAVLVAVIWGLAFVASRWRSMSCHRR